MTVRNIKKNLAGAEDLLHGIGIESQSRGGSIYDMHKLDTYVPTYDVTEMQRSSLTFMRLYGTDTAYTDYRRNPTGTVGIPSDLGGVWEPISSSNLTICGNFTYGAYVFSSDCVVGYNNSFMQWKGSLPKVVTAGSTPATSGGISADAWAAKTYVALRSELFSSGFVLNKITSTLRTLSDYISDRLTAKDFGAVGDGLPHPLSDYFSSLAEAQAVYPKAMALSDEIDHCAIQLFADYCGTIFDLSVAGRSFNKISDCYIPYGKYLVSDLDIKPGVYLVGDGPQSTVLIHSGNNGDCISTGKYLVASDRGAIEDKVSGGVKRLTVLGKKATDYDVTTIAGRTGKTHQTRRGINCDGGINTFSIEDVNVFYCVDNIVLDRCYTAELHRVDTRFASHDNITLYGSNLATLNKVISQSASRFNLVTGAQETDTGELAKCLKLTSCNFEYALYDGAYIKNVRSVEIDSCYFERNSQYFDDGTVGTSNAFLTIDGPSNSTNIIRNTLFNSISNTLPKYALLHLKSGGNCELKSNRWSANSANGACIKVGANFVGDIETGLNNIYIGASNVKSVDIAKGSMARIVPIERLGVRRNLIRNGDLQVWQNGTSQALQGIYSADGMYVFRTGSNAISFAQQAFTDYQSDISGYPQYFGRFTLTGTSTSWGVRYSPESFDIPVGSDISHGVWLRASSACTAKLNARRSVSGVGLIDSQSHSFNVTTDWAFYSAIFSFDSELPATTTRTNTETIFEVEFGSDLSDGYFDISNIGVEFGHVAGTVEQVSYADQLSQCQQYFIVESAKTRFSGNVTSGQAYKISVDFPTPMKSAPSSIAISSVTAISFSSTATVSEITKDGFVVSFTASATAYGEIKFAYKTQ